MGSEEGGRWDDGWGTACSSWGFISDAKTTSPIKTTPFKTPTSPALLSFSFIVPTTVRWEPCCERSHTAHWDPPFMPMFFHFGIGPCGDTPLFLILLWVSHGPTVWNLARHTHDPRPCSLSTPTAMARKEPWNKQKCLSPEGTEVTAEAANQTQAANCEPCKRESNP